MPIYQLSDHGRSLTWNDWKKKLDGCSLCDIATWEANKGLGLPESHWPKDLTLGAIEDTSPLAGRELARFAVEHLELSHLAIEYRRPSYE